MESKRKVIQDLIGRYKMPTYRDLKTDGYEVSVRPRQWFRRKIRYRFWYIFPIWDDDPIYLKLKISCDNKVVADNAHYTWSLKRESDDKRFGSGKGIIDKTVIEQPITSQIILRPDKYFLIFNLFLEGKSVESTLATLPVRDREEDFTRYFTLFLGVVLSIIASIITSIITVNLIGG